MHLLVRDRAASWQRPGRNFERIALQKHEIRTTQCGRSGENWRKLITSATIARCGKLCATLRICNSFTIFALIVKAPRPSVCNAHPVDLQCHICPEPYSSISRDKDQCLPNTGLSKPKNGYATGTSGQAVLVLTLGPSRPHAYCFPQSNTKDVALAYYYHELCFSCCLGISVSWRARLKRGSSVLDIIQVNLI